MKLKELYEEKKYNTDKFTGHSYLNTYDELFSPLQENVNNILEIGIQKGESLLMWKDFFKNAEVYGADVDTSPLIIGEQERIHIKQGNAYTLEFIESYRDIKFDIMIDDGSHLIEHMEFFCRNYYKLLNNKGIMVVEDIAHFSHAQQLLNSLPKELQKKAKIIDLRKIKGRWDDVLLVVN